MKISNLDGEWKENYKVKIKKNEKRLWGGEFEEKELCWR